MTSLAHTPTCMPSLTTVLMLGGMTEDSEAMFA